ncbi:hypothetical protein MMC07_008610 [Pseudocyphellaria aurata]|nr:hypothetical protein [Pseudocyphellaria aurata]
MSNASFVSDVGMAHDEVFSGPISESVPSSITGFVHRRPRSDSMASFTYFQDYEESPEWAEDVAIEDESDENLNLRKPSEEELRAQLVSSRRHRSSQDSAKSVEDPLLNRRGSTRTDVSAIGKAARINQKIYVVTEDLTVVVAGFDTRPLGFFLYVSLCTITLGLVFLLLRWLPRWRVRLIGSPKPLRDCTWVVTEVRLLLQHKRSEAAAKVPQNQWGEFTIQDIVNCQYGHPVSTVFGSTEKDRFQDYDEDDDPMMLQLRFLDYRYVRFCFHPLKDKFVLCGSWRDPKWTNVRSIRIGLDGDERYRRKLVFGPNQIDIQQKSVLQLLIDEAFHPFYVFQIASLILWSLDEYYYYAVCIFFISVISITATLLETRSTMIRLRELSRFECEVRVLRNGFWRQVISTELVPGDVYEISDPSLPLFPCDSLLLAGDCIVNESMLTGESVPVTKTPATNKSLHILDLGANSINPEVAKHFLFGGTKIVRARRPQGGHDDEAVALAIVVRTGFNTTKGALVRSMLFPRPLGFKFYRDAFRYISVMGIVGGIGFFASFLNFVLLGVTWGEIIIRALDLITIVVPPALPATLSIGTSFALSRLKKKNIFCISPQRQVFLIYAKSPIETDFRRVNVGGKLDIICFDKTGTLTEDGLDVLGVRVVHRPAMGFSDILHDAATILHGPMYERDPTVDYHGIRKAALYTMATCHSLHKVEGELVGDPLDVKMFEFTGWSFEESGQVVSATQDEELNAIPSAVARSPAGLEIDISITTDSRSVSPIELGILKTFEFVSQLRRASVIVRSSGAHDGDIYVKGAPECMKEICHPDSFPMDYDELLGFYTHRGFRVIACATKHVQNLNKAKVQAMDRSDAESGLEFVGFIIFENKLKPISAAVIKELSEAGIRKIMCTGDNILTAISVARECNLIHRTAHCFVPKFYEGKVYSRRILYLAYAELFDPCKDDVRDSRARLKWQSVDNPLFELDERTLLPLPPPADSDASLPYDMSNIRDFALAVTGEVFRWFVEYGSEEILKRILACGQIFARMSPDEKQELVEKLQSIDYCCGFCGDGANDCGALKAADVGISLSEAEASVAAPFTSRIFDTSCVPEVIREGRAALVTSFCCFKYMSLYSAIQFTSVSLLYASASNLADFQFLFIDLCLILPIAIFMGWTSAYPILSRKRPTATLVSQKVLTPLMGQVVVCILIQLIGFETVQRQEWYIPPTFNVDKPEVENSEDTTLFLVSSFQYILSGIVLSIGPPFRLSMAKNLPFVITVVVDLLFFDEDVS